MVNAAAIWSQSLAGYVCKSNLPCAYRRSLVCRVDRVRIVMTELARIFDFQPVFTAVAEPQVVGRTVTTEYAVRTKHSSSRSKPARAAAHPSTAEEHARAGQEAQAESQNRNTSDEYLQEETEQKRTSRARTAFNIVFVTSEVSLQAVLSAFLESVCSTPTCRAHTPLGCAGGSLVQNRRSW